MRPQAVTGPPDERCTNYPQRHHPHQAYRPARSDPPGYRATRASREERPVSGSNARPPERGRTRAGGRHALAGPASKTAGYEVSELLGVVRLQLRGGAGRVVAVRPVPERGGGRRRLPGGCRGRLPSAVATGGALPGPLPGAERERVSRTAQPYRSRGAQRRSARAWACAGRMIRSQDCSHFFSANFAAHFFRCPT